MYTIREIGENIKDCDDFKGDVLFDFPMHKRTTMRVGGNASLIIEPADEKSLAYVLKLLSTEKLGFFVLGGGSNLVVSDDGVDIPVVSLRRLKSDIVLTEREDGDLLLKCSSGTSWGEILNFCTENNISGLLEFAGLPGTVGGAVFMNAGCFGNSISKVLKKAEYMTESGDKGTYEMNDADWAYKKSPFQDKKWIATSVFLRVSKSNDDVKNIALSYIEQRKAKGHFKKPCAGSVFRNPEGVSAGLLIDECGLKGFSIGGAKIAPWHANIIINEDNATQKDIKSLVDYIKTVVKQKKNVLLEPEIIFW